MGIFKNDLDSYISLIQTEEILESHHEQFKKHNREMGWRIGITTGAVAATSYTAAHYDKPELFILSFASVAIVNSVINLYNYHKLNKLFKPHDYINLDELSYKEVARRNRDRAKYKGDLKYIPSYKFHRQNAEDIEKHFGYESDNDLPIHFLEKSLVSTQVLDEYDMFNKKYDLPILSISEDELKIFIDELEKLLKKKMLSHRIYFYTSEYFKRLLAKGLINYWDEISIKTLLDELYCLEKLEYTEEEIEAFKKELQQILNDFKNSKRKLK